MSTEMQLDELVVPYRDNAFGLLPKSLTGKILYALAYFILTRGSISIDYPLISIGIGEDQCTAVSWQSNYRRDEDFGWFVFEMKQNPLDLQSRVFRGTMSYPPFSISSTEYTIPESTNCPPIGFRLYVE